MPGGESCFDTGGASCLADGEVSGGESCLETGGASRLDTDGEVSGGESCVETGGASCFDSAAGTSREGRRSQLCAAARLREKISASMLCQTNQTPLRIAGG